MIRWTKATCLNAAVLAIIFMVFVSVSHQFTQTITSYRPPYIFHSVTTDRVVMQAGEPLRVTYLLTHVRMCRTEVDRFISRDSDGAIVWRERVPGAAIELGEQRVVMVIPLPKDLVSGTYVLKTIPNAECGNGFKPVPAPDLTFTVV